MAGTIHVIFVVLVLCLSIHFYTVAGSQYDACRRVLLHSDFRTPCVSLSMGHKRPCLMSTPADHQYLKDAKIKYLYRAPGVTGAQICAPRWNQTQSADCVPAPKEADNSVGWTWSEWSALGGGTRGITRRVTLTGYKIGTHCLYVETKVLKDCAAARDAGLPSGVTTILPDNMTPMDVYCDQDTAGGGWIVFQKRISYSDFYLYWVNYTAGFGDPSTNYWLGLDNIHLLTSLSYTQLKVVLEYPAGTFAHADYSVFVVGDASTDYTLQVSGYSSTTTPPAGNSLGYNNVMKFSTRDVENDLRSGSHCAQIRQGAWWYKSCTNTNLNGPYYYLSDWRGTFWKSLTSSREGVLSSMMMVQ